MFNTFMNAMLKLGRVDTDGVPKGKYYQCVDLVKRYMLDEFSVPYGSYGNAIDYWYRTAPAILRKFTKVAGSQVMPGDIVVLETNHNPIQRGMQPGHIGLATGIQDGNTFQLLEQNGDGNGTGLGGGAIRVRTISKYRIAGILRPLTAPGAPAQAAGMPAIGARIKLAAGTRRTTFRAGTTQGAGQIYVRDDSYIYTVRAYDPVYKNRILINSRSAGGDGVALALFYTSGARIEGWEQV